MIATLPSMMVCWVYFFVFLVGKNFDHLASVGGRLLHLHTQQTGFHVWHGREMTIDAAADQPVWTDGEYDGRILVSIRVVSGGLQVAVPV